MVFVNGQREQRLLHCLPTRRSSGLSRAVPQEALSRSSLPTLPGPPVRLAPAVRAKSEDRKSTRLNSSHRCISYAVFCLKKKKSLRDDGLKAPEAHKAD